MAGELALTLPFVFLGILFTAIAYTFGKEAVGQKIFFIGMSWLMGVFSVVAMINVAQELGYSGIEQLATGALTILLPSLLLWFIYIVAKTFTDILPSVLKKMVR